MVLSLVTGCVYSPKDDHSTHYHSPNEQVNKQTKDDDYVQQYKQVDDDAPFYNNGFNKL